MSSGPHREHGDTGHVARRTGAEPSPGWFQASRDIRQPRPQITDAERDADRVHARTSLLGSAVHRAAVLDVSCPAHDAVAGVACWHSHLSGVRGFCLERWQRAIPETQRVVFGTGVAR